MGSSSSVRGIFGGGHITIILSLNVIYYNRINWKCTRFGFNTARRADQYVNSTRGVKSGWQFSNQNTPVRLDF